MNLSANKLNINLPFSVFIFVWCVRVHGYIYYVTYMAYFPSQVYCKNAGFWITGANNFVYDGIFLTEDGLCCGKKNLYTHILNRQISLFI